MTTRDEGADRILQYLAEGRLLRMKWRDDLGAYGRERACLLAALAPECGMSQRSAVCPTSTLWPWLAHLTPWIDDAGSASSWPSVVRRYAEVVRRLDPGDADGSRRCDYAVRAIAVREAMRHVRNPRRVDVCRRAAEACEKIAQGCAVDDGTLASLRANAALVSAEAKGAAAAAELVEAAADAAEAAAEVAEVVGTAASKAASDRMIDAILSVLERHVGIGGRS